MTTYTAITVRLATGTLFDSWSVYEGPVRIAIVHVADGKIVVDRGSISGHVDEVRTAIEAAAAERKALKGGI